MSRCDCIPWLRSRPASLASSSPASSFEVWDDDHTVLIQGAKGVVSFPIIHLALFGSDETLSMVSSSLPLGSKLIIDLNGQGEHCLSIVDGRVGENRPMADLYVYLYDTSLDNSFTLCATMISATASMRNCPALLSQVGDTRDNNIILQARQLAEKENMAFYQYNSSGIVDRCIEETANQSDAIPLLPSHGGLGGEDAIDSPPGSTPTCTIS